MGAAPNPNCLLAAATCCAAEAGGGWAELDNVLGCIAVAPPIVAVSSSRSCLACIACANSSNDSVFARCICTGPAPTVVSCADPNGGGGNADPGHLPFRS